MLGIGTAVTVSDQVVRADLVLVGARSTLDGRYGAYAERHIYQDRRVEDPLRPEQRNPASLELEAALERVVRQALGMPERLLGEKPRRETCEGMEGLLTEGEEVMNKTPAGALRDAVMVTSAQKVEHYEIASYGTARTYAEVLGESGVARILAQTLKE